jgi:hypothetical protein
MLVIRRGGTASLKPLVEQLERVRDGADRTASELAIERLDREIGALRSQKKDPMGFGCCLFWALALGALGLYFALGLFPSLLSEPSDPLNAAFFLLGVGMIAVAVAGVVVVRRGQNQEHRENEQLDSLIARKTEEWRRHQDIVGKVRQD